MKKIKIKFRLNLFGEGGGAPGVASGNVAAGSPSASATTTGDNSSAAENNSENKGVVGNKTDTPTTRSLEERRKAYDDYIKGDGKEFYDKDTQEIVRKRLKGEKALKDQLGKLNPFIEALADKYSHDPADLEGLMAKISNDRDFYAEAAAEAGMEDPETYRKFRESERKIKAFEAEQKRIADAEEAQKRQTFVDQKVQAWRTEAEALKGKYPDLDLDKELDNKEFAGMLRVGVSLETAYQAMHHSEILQRELDTTKSETEKAVIDNLRAKGQRPVEGGANTSSAPLTGVDVSKLTKKERADLARQAAYGKRIEF